MRGLIPFCFTGATLFGLEWLLIQFGMGFNSIQLGHLIRFNSARCFYSIRCEYARLFVIHSVRHSPVVSMPFIVSFGSRTLFG